MAASSWTGYVCRIAANPFQRVTGTLLQLKMVYLGCLIEAYADTKLLTELESNRNDQVYNGDGKNIMRWYEDNCRKHNNDDVAMERSRNRARNYYENNNTRGFFPMPNFKMWLSILKVKFLQSGIWEFEAKETMILIFFHAKVQNVAFYF